MLVPRSQMGVAVLDGYLYVVGGTSRHHEVLQSVERYSFEEVLVFSTINSYLHLAEKSYIFGVLKSIITWFLPGELCTYF